MKRSVCVLSLFLIFFASCGPKETSKIKTPSKAELKPVSTVKILSLNLNGCRNISSISGLKKLSAFIKNQDVDIVALEDISLPITTVRPNYVKELSKLIEFQLVVGTNRLPQLGEHGNAILSRLPILKSENVMLPPLKRNNDHGILFAAIDLGATKIIILSTHLDQAIGEEDEVRIADAFTNLEEEFKDFKMFICGTFYDDQDSPLLKTLLNSYTNAADIASYPADQPAQNCSYILFPASSNFIINEKSTFDSGISTHLAILAKLTFMAPAQEKK